MNAQGVAPSTSTVESVSIADGAAGIEQTLGYMSRLSRAGKKSMTVRETALRLIKGCGHKDWACQVRSVHAFVRDSIQYVLDPVDVELVQTPDKTLELGAGDCDDKAVLLAALLGAIGHPSRYYAIGFDPGVYCHVLLETRIGDSWIALETTEPVEAGWTVPAQAIRTKPLYRTA